MSIIAKDREFNHKCVCYDCDDAPKGWKNKCQKLGKSSLDTIS